MLGETLKQKRFGVNIVFLPSLEVFNIALGNEKYLVALHVTIGIIIILGIIISLGIITMFTPKNQLNVNFMSDLGNSLINSRCEH